MVTQIAMADSVYISRNLTGDQLLFLRKMEEHEILYFNMEDIETRLNHRFENLREVLENLVDKDLLVRLEKGKYSRYDFQDRYVLAAFMSKEGVVAYWSALHMHGLTDRFPNTLFIKTPARKRNKSLFNTPVQYVTVDPRKMVGISLQGYGDKSYRMTDPEATILDGFDQPRYIGDWADLLRAFQSASLNAFTLSQYAATYNNMSAFKRMGYMAELLKKSELEPFVSLARLHLGKKYTLFEPGGPDKGTFNRKWMLRMNMEEDQIMNILQSPY